MRSLIKLFTSKSRVKKLDQLPVELIELIFSFLPLKCLMVCEKTCRKFFIIIDNLKNRNLFIKVKDTGTSDLRLELYRGLAKKEPQFFDQRLLGISCIVDPSSCLELNDKLMKIKQLFVNCNCSKRFEIEFLNQFWRLEFLNVGLLDLNANQTLILKHLRILKMSSPHPEPYNAKKLTIISPRLLKVCLIQIEIDSNLEFVYPESIKYLETYEVCLKDKKLPFSNLEHLICRQFNLNGLEKTASKLRKLKELDIGITYQIEKESLNNLGYNLDSNRIKIRVNGIDFKILSNHYNDNKPNLKNRLDPAYLDLYFKDYSNSAKSLCHHYVFYNHIDQFISKNNLNLPDSFATKFQNLRKIVVFSAIKKKKQFYSFLIELPNLIELRLDRTGLSNKFYKKRLTTYCPFIKVLEINEDHSLNFEFLLKFINLHRFYTNQVLKSNLIFELFHKFNYSREFTLKCSH